MKKKKAISYKKHQERTRSIAGMKVIGINPAKEKHQLTVIDEQGIQWRGPESKALWLVLSLVIKQ